jgi:hypothetical protein
LTAAVRALEVVRPPARLFRISRKPDPWAWPDWAYVSDDRTFGNRWDDPKAIYRVLYAASQRQGAFLEVLARFRVDPAVVAGLARIAGEADAIAPGTVPASWLRTRVMGEGLVLGTFAHVGRSRSLAHLRELMAPRLVHYGLSDLDAGTIRLTAPRRLTQEISRCIFEMSEAGSVAPSYHGICYLSRLGDEFENWAIFEMTEASDGEPRIEGVGVGKLVRDDSDLQAAVRVHGLTLAE